MEPKTLWFLYFMFINPDGSPEAHPHEGPLAADPSQENCLAGGNMVLEELDDIDQGFLKKVPVCVELPAEIADDIH